MKNGAMRVMVLGLALLLFSIQISTQTTIFYGYELFISILGLAVVIIGFFIRDRT